MRDDSRKIIAVVPAAGVGSRMSTDVPKQYLTIQNKPIIQITIEKLLAVAEVSAVVVAISENDSWWGALSISSHEKVHTTIGGADRSQSVKNALLYCRQPLLSADENTWALVHDAARPCVTNKKVQNLIDKVFNIESDNAQIRKVNGGILAYPIADTVKRATLNAIVSETVDRSGLWLAHTPQLFRLNYLHDALVYCHRKQVPTTDEASAVEAFGGRVLVVHDQRSNIKITVPEDLQLAEHILMVTTFPETNSSETHISETDRKE